MSLSKLPNVPSEAPQVSRRPRGRINKRACEKCRQLKIRCDGDAQEGSVCSNCDKGSCVYDQSPRKNRQVEKLKTQVNDLESNIKQISNNFENQNFQLEVLRMEKKILSLLINCQTYFYEAQSTFSQLVQCMEESRCLSIFLPIIRDLLLLISNENQGIIISCLKMIAESTLRCCEQDSSLGSEYPEEWTKEILNFVANNNLSVSVTNNATNNLSVVSNTTNNLSVVNNNTNNLSVVNNTTNNLSVVNNTTNNLSVINNTTNNLSVVNNSTNTLSIPTTNNATTNLRMISRAVSPSDSMSTIVSSSSPIVDGDGLEINNINMLEFHNGQVPLPSSSFIQHTDPYYPIDNINNDSNHSNNSNNSSENVDYASFLNLDPNSGSWQL
ncbi:6733_t:CDS:1 [Diversispora eburnea]|uniref:6733_t:CDS:1 n=2 Tax=Diversisporales TaxID=214509 RepID=A0A9N8VJL0_9GLOM|nr:6733_t:CDS:1 [Diversispora eburnea]CAG8450944.1 20644_t:CDS:1 [Dentiscutata erythropus]